MIDQVEQIRGPYKIQVLIGGSLEKPQIKNGFFKLENGELELSRVRNTISDLSIDATIKDSIMTIHSLSGYAAEEKIFWQKTWEFIRN